MRKDTVKFYYALSIPFCKTAAQQSKYKQYVEKRNDEQSVNETMRVRGFNATICEIGYYFIIAQEIYNEIKVAYIKRNEQKADNDSRSPLITSQK